MAPQRSSRKRDRGPSLQLDPELEALIPERARPKAKVVAEPEPPKRDTSDPRNAISAHRPLRPAGAGRRALSNVGGEIETDGDEPLAELCAKALSVRAGEGDATLTHPFHAYPARMHPDTPRTIVTWAREHYGTKATVLDPFCGSGTVLVEAFAYGLASHGSDLSGLAVELAGIKTRRTTVAMRRELVNTARAIARTAETLAREEEPYPVPRGEEEWFAERPLVEVAALCATVDDMEPGFLRNAMRMLFSSLLVKASRQRADSATDKVDKRVPPGWIFEQMGRKALELSHCLTALSRAVPEGTPEPVIHTDDATRLTNVPAGSIHAVITSPPYANTYDYAAHHARRHAWLRLDSQPIERDELGASRWFRDDPDAGVARFTRELDALCASLARVLAPDGVAFLLVGDGAAGPVPLRAEADFARAATTAGLTLAARASQTRPNFDQAMDRAFRESPKREHLLALRRPAAG